MSNKIINWRFWYWHLQVVEPSQWAAFRRRGGAVVTWHRNDYHLPARRKGGWWWPVAIYEGRGYFGMLVLAVVLAVLLVLS